MSRMTAFPPRETAPGASNPPNPNPSATPSGNDGSGRFSGPKALAAVEALAALLEPEAFDPDVPAAEEWRESAQNTALGYAARAFDAGYRRVVEDDTTVERVARSIAAQARARYDGPDPVADWESDLEESREEFRFIARAAVRALREDT